MALQPIVRGDWHLVVEATGEPVCRHAEVRDFRGELRVIVGGSPPHRPGVSGYVETEDGAESYVTVFDLKWVQGA